MKIRFWIVVLFLVSAAKVWAAFPPETGTVTVPITVTHTVAQPTLSLVFVPNPASIPSTTPLGGNVAALQGVWSDGSPFTGSFIFVAPNFDAGGTYSVNGSELVVNPNGPGVSALGGTAQHVTMEAVQSAPAVTQTLLPLVQQASTVYQFLAGTGSANAPVGNIIPATLYPTTPAFTGSWAITGGPDAGKFKINSATGVVSVCNTAPSCTDLPAGTYTIVISVTQSGVTGSPASTTATLQGVDQADTTTLFVQPDNYYPVPGSTFHVNVRNAPNTNGSDYAQIVNQRGIYSNGNIQGVDYQLVGAAGIHNATLSLTVPAPPSDNYQFLYVAFGINNAALSQAALNTPTILTAPTLSPVKPSAANTLAPPFTPAQTLAVCPSGCQYPTLSAALIGLSNANIGGITDNVLITMQAGVYYDCSQFGNSSPFSAPTSDRIWHLPQHLWIKGIGGNFAHFEGGATLLCNGKGTIVFWGSANDTLWLDNLEVSDWAANGPTAGFYLALGNAVMRNDYLHDGEDCILSGNSTPANFVVDHLHLARCGGPNGPQHNAYFGEGANTLNWTNTFSEQVMVGHGAKSRAFVNHFTCNLFIGSQDPYYVDSEEIDCPEGRECHIDNNTLVKGPGSPQQNQIGWAMDDESGPPPQTLPGGGNAIYSLTLNNNIIIDDESRTHWFVYIGPNQTLAPIFFTSPPNTWNHNIFVGGASGFSYPYASFHSSLSTSYPDASEITEVGDQLFTTRAAAGITQTYPPPPGCSGTIGNMAIP